MPENNLEGRLPALRGITLPGKPAMLWFLHLIGPVSFTVKPCDEKRKNCFRCAWNIPKEVAFLLLDGLWFHLFKLLGCLVWGNIVPPKENECILKVNEKVDLEYHHLRYFPTHMESIPIIHLLPHHSFYEERLRASGNATFAKILLRLFLKKGVSF